MSVDTNSVKAYPVGVVYACGVSRGLCVRAYVYVAKCEMLMDVCQSLCEGKAMQTFFHIITTFKPPASQTPLRQMEI